MLLETNLDDVTGESLGYAIEQLWAAGALDVATSPLAMKKQRPGVLLAVQCRPDDADRLAEIVFRETTALGLRRSIVSRLTLPRRAATVETPFGSIAGVVATLPGGAERFSPEYESCRRRSAEAWRAARTGSGGRPTSRGSEAELDHIPPCPTTEGSMFHGIQSPSAALAKIAHLTALFEKLVSEAGVRRERIEQMLVELDESSAGAAATTPAANAA